MKLFPKPWGQQPLSFKLEVRHAPNISFQGTKTRALRGFGPLNSDR